MQSTGQISTHALSLTPTQGSQITYAISRNPFYTPPGCGVAVRRHGPEGGGQVTTPSGVCARLLPHPLSLTGRASSHFCNVVHRHMKWNLTGAQGSKSCRREGRGFG